MYHESMVVRTLAVLRAVNNGATSLEDIAEAAGYRVGPVQRSLTQLQEQGLLAQGAGQYSIALEREREIVTTLAMTEKWIIDQKESFYEIAKAAAQIILTKSWQRVGVQDVLLYGSTLRNDRTPRDIDLVILHSGSRLAEYDPPQYATEGAKNIPDVAVGDPETTRRNVFDILFRLGHREEEARTNSAVRLIGDRIEYLHVGSIPQEEIDRTLSFRDISEKDVGAYIDLHGISNIFDVHVMHTGLLGDLRGARENFAKIYYASARKTAIESCKDRTFWHRVLSEGRLYDIGAADFSRTVEDKYPGVLELFKQ